MENTNNNSNVKIVSKERISAIWLVPIIALLFGAWLVFKSISERGVFITVQFNSGNGFVVGKTKVKYKGLDVGVVRNVEISKNLKGIIVEIEMAKNSAPALTENTKFWFVTADITLQGVKGLDTLLSGSYISVLPDFSFTGKPQRKYIALDEEPPIDETLEGLHLTLTTDKLGSIAKDSPVSFKQINVGYVSSYKYQQDNNNKIEIKIFIKPEHAHLVKKNTHFWNASGFDISGSLTSGINIKTQSLASIVAGGISFDTNESEGSTSLAENGDSFQLFNDYADAQMSTEIELILAEDSGVDIGTAILFEGITLGRITSFVHIDPYTRKTRAKAEITLRVEKFLTDQTDFFIVTPQIDLSGVSNLSSLLTGSYIGVRPSIEGERQHSFNVYAHKPAYKYNVPGLHILLDTADIASLHVGSGIYYKQQLVGEVQAIENIGPDKFIVHAFIKPQYQQFVSADSRFWHDSGVSISGGLQHIEIKAKSIQTMLTGGISFDTGTTNKDKTVNNGESFHLYEEQDIAQQRVEFTLNVAAFNGIKKNTRIMYRGEKIGQVHNIVNKGRKAIITAGLIPNANFILKEDSQFWLVKPEISLAGFTDSDALFGGAYIAVNVGEGKNHTQFNLNLTPPAKHSSTSGLQLVLSTNKGNVVTPGSSISYQGIIVGQVDNVAIAKSEKNIDINITVFEEYRHLITNYTRFYNASGITVSGGFSNITVKTESADAILKGAISFYNPDNELEYLPTEENSRYGLFDHIDHARAAGLAIEIHFNNFAGLTENTKIKYQEQEIGLVERVVFDKDGFGATVFAFLNDNGSKFALSDTQFWFAEPEIGLVGSKNISGILDGGFISIIPGQGSLKTKFIAEDIPPVVKTLPYGLNIKLTAKVLGSVRVGNPVLYRQVKVGSVIGVGLANTADSVNIYINIAEKYSPLVSSQSKFWNTSGFTVDAGMLSGVKIESQSIETLIAGGIAFATPESTSDDDISASVSDQTFTLYDDPDSDWFKWQPQINIK